MSINTMLLIFISFLLAIGLSFYQYFLKAKSKSKVNLLLAFLRFLTVFGVLVLLINPIITWNQRELVKPVLALVVDNSESISFYKSDDIAKKLQSKLESNKQLNEKFEVQSYQFDSEFQAFNNPNFTGSQTNIDLVAKNLKSINKKNSLATVLISDGNQTSGNDYVYSFENNNKVFPLVLGDTTRVLDLKISQINVNKYAFHKNKFPAEVFLEYSGNKSITADFQILNGKNVFAKQRVFFSPDKKSVILNTLLPAEKVGIQIFKATVSSSEKELSTINNNKNFVVEIIDQKTNVAIVSSINHPDIGALKRAIESNEQRKVNVYNPINIKDLNSVNVLILYQPTAAFMPVFEQNKLQGLNSLVIGGTHTDYSFLNKIQSNVSFKFSQQNEEFQAKFNNNFNIFEVDNIGFESFPPLNNLIGKISTNSNVTSLLSSRINTIDTDNPLLFFVENQELRTVFFLGENSWKWRMQFHADNDSYEKYDLFIDKIIQFLATTEGRKSLVVNHNNYYNSGDLIEISAQHFNKNYEYDQNARLTITIVNNKTKKKINYDLLKGNNSFKVNLDGLEAGTYNFTVREINSKETYSSQFEILEFDIEKQFVNPDLDRLNQLAIATGGKVFFPDKTDRLIKDLLDDDTFKTIEKNHLERSPLIDWKWLLIMVSVFLSLEWFIRKYNGLL